MHQRFSIDDWIIGCGDINENVKFPYLVIASLKQSQSTCKIAGVHPYTMSLVSAKFGNGVNSSVRGDRGQRKCPKREPDRANKCNNNTRLLQLQATM